MVRHFMTLFLCVALSLDDQIGNFEVGKDFDALRVNVAAPGGPIDLIQSDGPKVRRHLDLHKFIKNKKLQLSAY